MPLQGSINNLRSFFVHQPCTGRSNRDEGI
jgi:hypothetical protein